MSVSCAGCTCIGFRADRTAVWRRPSGSLFSVYREEGGEVAVSVPRDEPLRSLGYAPFTWEQLVAV